MKEKSLSMYFGTLIIVITCLESSQSSKTVITYNAALYEGVGLGSVPSPPSREARRDAIITELMKPENAADLVCLQEIWFGEDSKVIIDGLASVYPYTYSPLHDRRGNLRLDGFDRSPACGRGIKQGIYFSLLITCVEKNCANIETIAEGASCLLTNCALRYLVLNIECIECLLTTAPDVVEMRQKCSRPFSLIPLRYRNINLPDMLLLSKTPMRETSSVDFHPKAKEYTGFYGYIQAKVSEIGQVACVHSTPYGSSGLSFYPEFQIRLFEGIKSYEEQGAVELTQLVTKFGSTSPVFVLGDFNVGDAVDPDIDATQLANYQILTSAFQTQQHNECTYCSVEDNAYNKGYKPEVIDHIFYKGWTYSPGSSVRIFDSARVEGLPLSDHFGVKQTFS